MTLSAAAAQPDFTIRTRLFGEMKIPAAWSITFEDGIPGFEAERSYALLPGARSGTYWLQSQGNPNLVFFLIQAALIDEQAFGETPDLMAIVTLPGAKSSDATANLRAPILLDRANQRGLQFIGIDETWSTTHPIDLAALLH